MNRMLQKATPLITATLLLTLLAAPVLAQGPRGAHLWFYSVEPPIPLPDPMSWDPNYSGVNADGWLNEGVVAQVGDWTSFSCWIGNVASGTCYDLTILISVNTEAASGIASMTLNGIPVALPWDSNEGNFVMPSHAPIGDSDWAGFAKVNVGDLAADSKMLLAFIVSLNGGADMTEAKIHLDAYGWNTDEHSAASWPMPLFAPFSHDATFVVPEVATVFLASSSLIAFGAYAYKRKKQ